jgi:arylsulfatase A-like enzyme/PKD repeat protein
MMRSSWRSAALAVSTGAAIALGVGTVAVAPPAEGETNARPNILLVNLDDMRPSDGTLDVMPMVRSWFQQEGVTYTRNYPSTPLCSPSRASLFTGRYGHNNGITGNGLDAEIAAMDQSATFQGYLHEGGYYTAMAGKFMNTVPLSRSPQQWDHWTFMAGGYTDVSYNIDGTVKRVPGYYSNVLGDEVVNDLSSFEQNDAKPWLIYVAPQAPHSPYTAEAQYANAAVPGWTRPASFNEADVSDKPSNVKSRPLLDVSTVEQRRTAMLRTMMSVDDMIARITDEITRLGEADNTLAVLTSDNGYLWGEHRILDKRFPYTDSETTTLIMRWPGHLAAGTSDDRLVSGVDMLPTLLDAAGITPTLKYPLDGTSVLSGPRRSQLLVEYGRSLDSPMPPWSSVVTPTAQYTHWYNSDTGALTFREYYDLVTDPDQLVNQLGDATSSNDPDVATWTARLNALRNCVGQQCVVTDDGGGGTNRAPTAVVAAPVCTGLTCQLSGAGSSDSDGLIIGYTWRFGDGQTGTGVTTSHTYSAAGTYEVTLTVTDDEGATGTAVRTVTLTDEPSTVVYRGGARTTVNAKQATVRVPAAVRAGDALLLLVSANRIDSTLGGPAGWTLLRRVTDSTMQSAVWWREATATDAGTPVSVTATLYTKTDVHLLAYGGITGPVIQTFAVATEPGTTAVHRTPTVAVTAPGWLVSYWADKTGTATGWTVPQGVVVRLQSVGTGGGRITSLSADSGAEVSTDTAGGITASSSAASNMAVMWSILLSAR